MDSSSVISDTFRYRVLKKEETNVIASDPFAPLWAGSGSEAILPLGKEEDCFVASLLAMTPIDFFLNLIHQGGDTHFFFRCLVFFAVLRAGLEGFLFFFSSGFPLM